MRLIMITGDYPGTAQHIARQIGLKNPEDSLLVLSFQHEPRGTPGENQNR